MNTENSAKINYSRYAASAWEETKERESKYKKLWLETQNHDLPGGPLKVQYRSRIRELREVGNYADTELESSLIEQRFNFSAFIAGQNYGYRTLLSLTRDEKIQREARQALIEETQRLINSGFARLIQDRNKLAGNLGFENYWIMKNSGQQEIVRTFLIKLDEGLRRISEDLKPLNPQTEPEITLEEAVEFYCSMLFANMKIPGIDVIVRKGARCPPGPAYVQTLEYRPEQGHLLGLNLPFVNNNQLKEENLGTLFHELTHLFHFASIDNRGAYAFPSELAKSNLQYESEALYYQNLVLSAWDGGPFTTDWNMLKDLVYLAETERQLYFLKNVNSSNILELVMRRIEEQYPNGHFRRTPIGASHLISEEHAAKYWIYPAAHWIGFQKTGETLKSKRVLSIPDYWAEGNEASYRIELAHLLNPCEINGFFNNDNLLMPYNLKKRGRGGIRRELDKTGLLDMLLK